MCIRDRCQRLEGDHSRARRAAGDVQREQADVGTDVEDHRVRRQDDAVAAVDLSLIHIYAVHRALGIGEQAGADQAVGDGDPRTLELAVEHLLDVVPFRHRQHIGAHVVDLLHRIVAGLVLFEPDAPAIQLPQGLEAVAGIGVDLSLIHI